MILSGGATRDEIVWDSTDNLCLSFKLYHPEPPRQRIVFSWTRMLARPSIRASSISSSSDASFSSCDKPGSVGIGENKRKSPRNTRTNREYNSGR